MDGYDGGPDVAGGLDGFDGNSMDGFDGLDGLDADFDHDSFAAPGYDFAEIDSAVDGLMIPSESRLHKLTRGNISDALLLSYDHCGVYDGTDSCTGGGFYLLDPVTGTFQNDTFNDGGSRAPLNMRRLSEKELEVVRRLADDPKRRLFGIHVTNHGRINLKDAFKQLAEAANCVRIDTVTPNFNTRALDDFIPEITDWNSWKSPFTRRHVPAGFYPDATGHTTIWRQYWQVKKEEPNRWLVDDQPTRRQDPKWRFDQLSNTVIEVTCVTWYYRQACDYETRLHLSLESLPYLDPLDKQWGYLKQPFKKYQAAARKIAELLLSRLTRATPDPIAVRNRGEIIRNLRAQADFRRAQHEAQNQSQQAPETYINPTIPTRLMEEPEPTEAPEMVQVKLRLPRRGSPES